MTRNAPRGPSAGHRRERSILLRLIGHTLRAVAALGAGLTLVGACLVCSPAMAGRATAWLAARTLDRPLALHARMSAAAKEGDQAAALAGAKAFLGAVPTPHPSDALGDKYRSALRTMMLAAEAEGRTADWLRAGELALAFDPNDSVLLFHFGRGLAAANRREAAVQMLEAAFLIRPNAPQILAALEPLFTPDQAAHLTELRQRHHEALALCMVLPSWMHGNLVAYRPDQSRAFDLDPVIDRTIEIRGPLEFTPTGFYLVLPRLAELELRVEEAILVGAGGETARAQAQPQGHLLVQPDGFLRITPSPAAAFDQPAVIGFVLPAHIPPNPELRLRISARASPEVAAVLKAFGQWSHPGVRVITSD